MNYADVDNYVLCSGCRLASKKKKEKSKQVHALTIVVTIDRFIDAAVNN